MDLLKVWQRVERWPIRDAIMQFVFRRFVPYTASVHPRLLHLEPGRVRAEMRDRRALRNHLGSLHAAALMNFAELVSGLAMVTAFPPRTRGIPVRFEVDYLKKARGTISAEAHQPLLQAFAKPQTLQVEVELRNAQGEVVCRARAHWHVGPA